MAEADDLDERLREADPDRWLGSRFIAAPADRADVIAVLAFDHELDRAPRITTEPLRAEIRLTWWREGVQALFAGDPPSGHPVMLALASAIARHGLSADPLLAMIDARIDGLYQDPFETAEGFERFADATAGAVMALSAAILARVDAQALHPLAQAWTAAGLARRGDMRFAEAGRAALTAGRAVARTLPPEAFPAAAHLALAGSYLATRSPGPLEKRLRLLAAVVTGRV
jgi:phytoene synthase